MPESCDVLIVGGGPAGSTCAWALRDSGLDVMILDKARFPRDKTCAGWITPQVITTLALDVSHYARGRVFQPMTSFQVGPLQGAGVCVQFAEPVSYGIRRFEFDAYLLERCGARRREGEAVRSIERRSNGWRINGEVDCRLLIGAGGHFCPVARWLREALAGNGGDNNPVVTAVEAEFPIAALAAQVGADGATPRLYFCEDLSGYGWCVRKEEYLNIGLGLTDSRETSARLPGLLNVVRQDGGFQGEAPIRFHGHAYRLRAGAAPALVAEGLMLIGDAAGLAYAQSGEGIRPAVESGILAARTAISAAGDYRCERLQPYAKRIHDRFGAPAPVKHSLFERLPASWRAALVRRLLGSSWFVRNILINRWFLHAHQPALETQSEPG